MPPERATRRQQQAPQISPSRARRVTINTLPGIQGGQRSDVRPSGSSIPPPSTKAPKSTVRQKNRARLINGETNMVNTLRWQVNDTLLARINSRKFDPNMWPYFDMMNLVQDNTYSSLASRIIRTNTARANIKFLQGFEDFLRLQGDVTLMDRIILLSHPPINAPSMDAMQIVYYMIYKRWGGPDAPDAERDITIGEVIRKYNITPPARPNYNIARFRDRDHTNTTPAVQLEGSEEELDHLGSIFDDDSDAEEDIDDVLGNSNEADDEEGVAPSPPRPVDRNRRSRAKPLSDAATADTAVIVLDIKCVGGWTVRGNEDGFFSATVVSNNQISKLHQGCEKDGDGYVRACLRCVDLFNAGSSQSCGSAGCTKGPRLYHAGNPCQSQDVEKHMARVTMLTGTLATQEADALNPFQYLKTIQHLMQVPTYYGVMMNCIFMLGCNLFLREHEVGKIRFEDILRSEMGWSDPDSPEKSSI
ncbi:hypothetical protein HDU76_001246, partial [Blyttiomyces sp. JEL0837]